MLKEQIEIKYANRVLLHVGLCITFYDFISIGDPYLYPSEGSAIQIVRFRMVVFRPFVGEIITGKLVSSGREGLKISTEFFEDILIPAALLQAPCVYNPVDGLWTWKYGEPENDFLMDIGEEVLKSFLSFISIVSVRSERSSWILDMQTRMPCLCIFLFKLTILPQYHIMQRIGPIQGTHVDFHAAEQQCKRVDGDYHFGNKRQRRWGQCWQQVSTCLCFRKVACLLDTCIGVVYMCIVCPNNLQFAEYTART